MGAFTYAMPRCVWMPHWLRQRNAAFAAAAAVLLSRFLNMTGVSVELSVAVFPSLPLHSLALSLRVKSVASICYCIAAFVYLRISATLSACVFVMSVCLYVATAHISFIKWQHDICKWNFPSTHLELPLPLPSWRCCFCCCHCLCRSLQLLKLTVRQIDWHLSNTFALNAFRRIIKFCVVSLSLHFFAVFYELQHFRPLKCVAYFLALQPSGICYLSVWQPKWHYLFNSIYWWNSLRKFSNWSAQIIG